MNELKQAIERILAENPARIRLSAPKAGAGEWRQVTFTRRADGGWQAEKLTATQAFHQALEAPALAAELAHLLHAHFAQLTAFTQTAEHALRLTKRGKLLTHIKKLEAPCLCAAAHDRPKRRLLPEGTAVPPLVDAGVMTRDGRVVAAMRDKYRQINRFVELVHDALPQNIAELPTPLRVVDFGCGKSSLTFILYYYLTHILKVEIEMIGLDLKAGVVAGCNAAAQKYGYHNLSFQVGDIAGYAGGAPPHMVVTLHACDTATDLALAKAAGWGAQMIFSVPCCQHELNAQMHSEALALLTRYGIVRERTAALMTDAIRANLLAACGYKAQLVEFVGFEHTPKNIMIRAKKAALPKNARLAALDEVTRLCAAFGFCPTLKRLLNEAGLLPKGG